MYILKINSEFYYQIDTGMLHLKKKSEPPHHPPTTTTKKTKENRRLPLLCRIFLDPLPGI